MYYEAGFAKGLGLPVIFTCREKNKKNLHFDTCQYSHIFWSDEDKEDFKEQLKHKIGATIN